jgi:nucleotide-binding universal stress UspA family protein
MIFKRILVPVDFTEKNQGAIVAARHFAVAAEGEVVLIHVIEELDLPFEELEDFYASLEDSAQTRIQVLADELRDAGITVETAVAFGKRVSEIVSFVSANAIDLVILTSHRLDPSNLPRNIMTISHQVAIAAQASVLLLR